MRHFSREYFPQADALADYLQHYADMLRLRIHYNTPVQRVSRARRDGPFTVTLAVDHAAHAAPTLINITCTRLLVATGMATPNVPDIRGIELAEGYEEMSTDPEDYRGQRVLILGNGNSAFESSSHLFGTAAYVHHLARRRVRLSTSTHYVGDVRSVNNNLLDNYQLKTLDVHHEAPAFALVQTPHGITLAQPDGPPPPVDTPPEVRDMIAELNVSYPGMARALAFEHSHQRFYFDRVIRALGFRFNPALFDNASVPIEYDAIGKYPQMTADYEAPQAPGLFFLGTIMHARDWRQSSGGFIHGFRYLVRSLHRRLEQRFHGVPWPARPVATEVQALGDVLLQRMNQASGPYQMFGVLGDVLLLPPRAAFGDRDPIELSAPGRQSVIDDDHPPTMLLEEVPLDMLENVLPGNRAFVVMTLEYGANFSYPGADTFRFVAHVFVYWADLSRILVFVLAGVHLAHSLSSAAPVPRSDGRVTSDPKQAHLSNFLHPVLRLYSNSRAQRVTEYHVVRCDLRIGDGAGGGGEESAPEWSI